MEGAGEGATSSGDLQQPDVKKQVEELWEEVARKANDHFRNSMPRRIIVRPPFLSLPMSLIVAI